MKRNEILKSIKMLAMSQGSYGRMLRQISEMDADTSEKFWDIMETQNFADPVDMVLFLEG